MVELLEEIEVLSKRVDALRADSPLTEQEERESRIRSVYAGLAIEEPGVTIEEVRRVLAPSAAL